MYPNVAALLLHLSAPRCGQHAGATLCGRSSYTTSPQWRRSSPRTIGARCWSRSAVSKRKWWVFPPLALAARYHPGRVPDDVLRAARSACPRVLRLAVERQSLTDVSWSNLRIPAFPGIAWSRTPLEALRFMRSRVFPSRDALAELVDFTRQPTAARPRAVVWPGTRSAHFALGFFAAAARPDDALGTRGPRERRCCSDKGRRLILDTRRLFCRLLRTLEIETVCDVGSMDGSDALRFRRVLAAPLRSLRSSRTRAISRSWPWTRGCVVRAFESCRLRRATAGPRLRCSSSTPTTLSGVTGTDAV